MSLKILFAVLAGCFAAAAAAALAASFYRRRVLSVLAGRKAPGMMDAVRGLFYGLAEAAERANAGAAGTAAYKGVAAWLDTAGYRNTPSVPRFILWQQAAAALFAMFVFLISADALIAAAGGAAGFFIPVLILKTRIRKNREAIAAELPDAMDLIAASIEGGLSLGRSVKRYCEKTEGIFASELGSAMRQAELGMSFGEALSGLETRLDMPEVSAFAAALTGAERTGGNVKDIIKAQAGDMRSKRFQYLKKKAHEAPVKLLIPLVLFIFPVIFMVLFGPIIIRLMKGM